MDDLQVGDTVIIMARGYDELGKRATIVESFKNASFRLQIQGTHTAYRPIFAANVLHKIDPATPAP